MMAESVTDQIINIVSEIEPRLIRIRRQLHQYPEIGFEEHRTAALIAEYLTGLGLTPQTGVGGTGVIVDLFDSKKPKVAFRVDMDALPIEEENLTEYTSQRQGFMHACGHDAHVAIGLGVAHILKSLDHESRSGIRIIFQPAEELTPGGALNVIAAGALENVENIYGTHVDPSIEVGTIGIKYGPLLASADTFEIEIIGKSGHAAHPHLAVDAVQIAAEVITALHSIPSRKINPVVPVVLSVTQVHGGSAKNILPQKVKLGGTIRTLDREIRQEMPRLIEQTVSGIVSTFGASYEFALEKGSPVLLNDKACTQQLENAGRKISGEEKVSILELPRMGAEDFANYLEHVPGAMLRVGTNGGEKTSHSLHSSHFDIDERAIAVATKVIAQCLIDHSESMS